MFSAGVGVGFLKLLESGFQKCWSRSWFFKTAGVGVGSQSWNPKKSSDSTTLAGASLRQRNFYGRSCQHKGG